MGTTNTVAADTTVGGVKTSTNDKDLPPVFKPMNWFATYLSSAG